MRLSGSRVAKEAVTLVVTRSTLGVLTPEVALHVAEEEHNLNPSFLRNRDKL